MRGGLRENWRIVLLTVLVVASLAVLFVPSLTLGDESAGGGAAEASQGATTMLYSIDLAGGTRIRAPMVGVTAEDVEISDGDELTNEEVTEAERAVADRLDGVDRADVRVRVGDQQVDLEVAADVSTDDLAAALDEAGYGYGTVREGVTEQTRQEAVRVIENKINEAGLSGGTVRTVSSGGQNFVLIEVPDEDRSRVIDLLEQRGSVTIDVYYPGDDGDYQQETVLTQEDFREIGIAQERENGQGSIPVRVEDDAAERFQDRMVETGVAQEGGSTCRYERAPDQTEPCLLVVSDDEVVGSFGMTGDLADSMRAGQWSTDPQFSLQTRNFSEARSISIDLRAGSLPAELDIQGGTSLFIAPTQGEQFRSQSLIVGIIAVLAVSGVVFVRYGDVRVALPMIATALSEVVILMGLAAFLRYPIDLAVIGGFIAVIGTGVDDLIIIGDGVLSEGDVNSRRVFQNRFRKALWVIGAAAGTTIIAMLPLASPFFSLGDLQGFAIFTIFGVIIGVIITRPAYGDILRSLMTDR